MHLFVKKATGQCIDCLYLLVWLRRQRQVCPKLSFELADSSSSCHQGSFSADGEQWEVYKPAVSSQAAVLVQVIPAWLQSTEMTEAHTEHNVLCLLPQGEWTDMSCLNKKLKCWSVRFSCQISISNGALSLVANFGICGSGLGRRLKKQGRAGHLQCLRTAGATPCPRPGV